MSPRLAVAVRRLLRSIATRFARPKVIARPLTMCEDDLMEPTTTDPLVIVNARHLDDLCELARTLGARLDPNDPLASALRGAIAQVRADSVSEPA